jgi:chromosome segregation ATPase
LNNTKLENVNSNADVAILRSEKGNLAREQKAALAQIDSLTRQIAQLEAEKVTLTAASKTIDNSAVVPQKELSASIQQAPETAALKAQLALLQATGNQYLADIQAINDEKTDLVAQLRTAQTNLTNITGQMQAVQTQLDTLQKQHDHFVQTDHARVVSVNSFIATQLEQLQDNLRLEREKVRKLGTEKNELEFNEKQTRDSLRSELAAKAKELSERQAEHKRAYDDAFAQRDDISNQLTALRGEYDRIVQENATNAAQLAAATASVQTLQSAKQAAEARIQALDALSTQNNAIIANLRQKHDALEAKNVTAEKRA